MKRRQWFVAATHETVLRLLRAPHAAIKVWFALALHANWSTGRCWPGYKKLKSEIGRGDHFINDGINWLSHEGLVEKLRRFGRSAVYTLRGYALIDASSAPKGELSSRERRTVLHQGESSSAPERRREQPSLNNNTKNERQKNNRRTGKPLPICVVVDDVLRGVKNGN